jgi:hypothetical protein
MIVDLILETGIAFRISTGLMLEHDRAAVGEDEPGQTSSRRGCPTET